MSDEQEKVDAGSEPSSAETRAVEETPAVETPEVPAEVETPADAGGAAETEAPSETPASSDESRTAFVSNARPGDEGTCPDGRKGTVHKFDEGLVCIPNADQG